MSYQGYPPHNPNSRQHPHGPYPPHPPPPYRTTSNTQQQYSYPPQQPQHFEPTRGAYTPQSQYSQPPGAPTPPQGHTYNLHQTWNSPYQSNEPNLIRGDIRDDYPYHPPQPSHNGQPPPTSQPPQNSGRPPPPADVYQGSAYVTSQHTPQRGGQTSIAPPPPPTAQQHAPPPPPPSYNYMYDDNPQQHIPSRSSSSTATMGPQSSHTHGVSRPQGPPPPNRNGPPSHSQQDIFNEDYTRKVAADVFCRFDRDCSGFLDLQEFMDVLRALHLAITYDDAKRKFYRADLDGNERISKREFIEMYVRERRGMYGPTNY